MADVPGQTINSMPVLTDDNDTSWLPQQPPQQPPQQQSPYYWGRLAHSLLSGATLPGDVATGKASMTDPATQQRVMDMTGAVMGGGIAGPAESDALNSGFRLFHGTQAKFERPSTDFIGTGQGAQSYGWGLYGAQAEPVALDMRNQLSGDALNIGGRKYVPPDSSPEERAMDWLRSGQIQGVDDPFDYAHQNIVEKGRNLGMDPNDISSSVDALRRWKQAGAQLTSAGHMQEWEVNANPEHFLDWDYLADEQSPHVASALQKAPWGDELQNHLDTSSKFAYRNPIGRDIYHWMTDDMDPQEASHALLDAGISGLRHLDANSRMGAAKNFGVPLPQATRNFILPDSSMIKVVRHYNAAGVPATFANMLDQPGQTP